jgi:hypothetical protein
VMIVAGVKLLKKRRDALKWSNRYAWTSLAGKVVNLILAFLYTFPMMKEMTERMATGTPGAPAMPVAMSGIMVGSAVLTILVMCTYPVLSLILLNRPRTKEWFAAQPQ